MKLHISRSPQISLKYDENNNKEEYPGLSILRNKFGNNMANINYIDDQFLLRFLKARQMNVNKAIVMLENYFNWRKVHNVDLLIKTRRETIRLEFYPRAYHGIDKIGRPIYIDCIGRSNIKQLLNDYSEKSILNYWIYEYEFLLNVIFPACCIQRCKKTGLDLNLYKTTCFETLNIIDLHGLGISQFNSTCRKIMRELIHVSQNYYPELLGQMFIVNAPSIFTVIWNFVKSLLDEKTVKKISVYSSKDNWKKKLLEYVDENQLPEFLGGTGPKDDEWLYYNFGPWADFDTLSMIAKKYPKIPREFLFSHYSPNSYEENIISN
ncbi:CRAL TRIO domain-containing protein [Cryptosporidium andersoni]|uniref:CRAL TRIO domain-containing protein n=1 Tax=Cryptosporidium andersoni TaxID=117008 RepID=A0A1J4MPJ8_9CRYT|nr:CRAL TRIO domain-containing protein [Cryptosporidium andersoni]